MHFLSHEPAPVWFMTLRVVWLTVCYLVHVYNWWARPAERALLCRVPSLLACVLIGVSSSVKNCAWAGKGCGCCPPSKTVRDELSITFRGKMMMLLLLLTTCGRTRPARQVFVTGSYGYTQAESTQRRSKLINAHTHKHTVFWVCQEVL